MQYFEAVYPKVVRLKTRSHDEVLIADMRGKAVYAMDPEVFESAYTRISEDVLVNRVIRGVTTVDFEEYQFTVAASLPHTTLSRLLYTLHLCFAALALLFGASPEKVTTALRAVTRVAETRGLSLGALAAEDPVQINAETSHEK